MHIRLEAIGGISGNMFVGALLDIFPQRFSELSQQLSLAGFEDLVKLQSRPKNDGVLTGTYFSVSRRQVSSTDHQHRPYRLIRETLEASRLSPAVKQHALSIFYELARAEAQVHGKAIETVCFHEVGAWDSIADIVCAAYLIDCLTQEFGSCRWSVSALPLGNGFVDSAHGKLPIPAPAVANLLKNFSFTRDSIDGERVTPTGAAIIKYLLPEGSSAQKKQSDTELVLRQYGYGFGSKQFPGISNVLRVLVFSDTGEQAVWEIQHVLQINFEVDDQTPEDISIATGLLRATDGVLDVCQTPVTGKKNRLLFSIQILADLNAERTVIAECFAQFTTIGLRVQRVQRAVLNREQVQIKQAAQNYQVKVAARPNGLKTAKVEAEDIASDATNQIERDKLRHQLQNDVMSNIQDNKADAE